MDWQKILTEFWRISRIAAANVGGAFGALAAVGKPITGNALWDIVICGVLNAIAFGTSRVSDGSTAIPGVQIKPGTLPRALMLGAVLTLGVMIPACSMGGCAGQTARTRVAAPALAYVAPEIRKDADFGVQALPPNDQEAGRAVVAEFFDAIQSKDRTRIAFEAYPRWPDVKALTLNGIDFQVQTDQIGPGVADMLREQVFRFEIVLNQLAQP